MKKKKYPLGGALIGAGFSTVTNVLGAIKANKQQKEQAFDAHRAGLIDAKVQDGYDLENFEENGYNLGSYYRLGGGVNLSPNSIKGGKADPLASDTVIMKGKTHEQGGIHLSPDVEVEHDEVIKGNKVYSDTLKTSKGITYADQAKKYAKERGELETNLKSLKGLERNSAKRKIEILNSKEENLFKEQQMKNGNKGGTKFEEGGEPSGFAKALEAGLPYLDNVVNAGLTLFTPKISKPTYIKPRKLETKVNVNDRINSVNNAVDSSTRFIADNTNNSTTARTAITAARLKGAGIKAGIYANKDNTETQLKNADIRNRQQIDSINAQKTDANNQLQTARQGEIQSRISANVANLADDAITKKNFDESKRYNNEQLAAVKSMFNNGVTTRTDVLLQNMLRKLQGLPPLSTSNSNQ